MSNNLIKHLHLFLSMANYPTPEHEDASKRIVEIFSRHKNVQSILLIGSCARGKASKDSCLDVCIIVKTKSDIRKIETKFAKLCKKEKKFVKLSHVGKYSHIDLLVTDGIIKPAKRDWTTGPDEYEIILGNLFVYSYVLWDRKGYFKSLQKKYLPYYGEKLRIKRLKEVKKFMSNNLNHIPLYVERGLYFQAFNRLYDATHEFIQALFIKNKIYPISYHKWIKEQFVEILDEPKLYSELVNLHEVTHLESMELVKKARKLKSLSDKYL